MTINGKISTTEKKELANLINKQFDGVINDLTQSQEHTQKEILEKVCHKLKTEMFLKQIADLQSKIDFLKNKIKDMGFEIDHNGQRINDFSKQWVSNDRWNSSQIVDRSTPAGKLFYSLMKHNPDITKLKDQRQELLKRLWLVSNREEVEKIVETKPCVKVMAIVDAEVK